MIVAGFGFRASATLDSLRAALAATPTAHPDAIAAPTDKAKVAIFVALAHELGVPVMAIAPDDMHQAVTRTQSARVIEKRGTGSVAEACALRGAGSNAQLNGVRVVSEDRLATCAIAQSPKATS